MVLYHELQAFFGVFDGHGGSKAAEFAAQKMEKNILEEVVRIKDKSNLDEAIKEGYLKTDAEFLKEDVSGGTCCVTALIQNFRPQCRWNQVSDIVMS